MFVIDSAKVKPLPSIPPKSAVIVTTPKAAAAVTQLATPALTDALIEAAKFVAVVAIRLLLSNSFAPAPESLTVK